MDGRPKDVALLEAWRGGDNAAGERLFDRHFNAVARFFRNKVSADIEDLVQKTFLNAVEARDRFRGDSSFRTYLLAIAHNVLRNHYRRHARKEGLLDFGTISISDMSADMSSIVARRQEHQVLLEALRLLPFDLQVILEFYFWEDMKAREIADVLDIPEGTVRTRIRLAKERLKTLIGELTQNQVGLRSSMEELERWVEEVRIQISAD